MNNQPPTLCPVAVLAEKCRPQRNLLAKPTSPKALSISKVRFSNGWEFSARTRDSGGINQQESVASQRRAIKDYCHRHRLVLVYFFADEEKVSSTTVGRDALEDLLYMAKQEPHPVEGMIFWSLARLARDQLDSQFIKIDLRRRGYVIHSMTDDIPDGEFAPVVEALIDWKNERLLKYLSKEVKRGLADLAKKGFAPGGFPPRGYLAEKVQIGGNLRAKQALLSKVVAKIEMGARGLRCRIHFRCKPYENNRRAGILSSPSA